MHILIVEDDLIIGKNIETALLEEGFEVMLCRDGLTGETALKDNEFDCVILDINLPGKTGIELCRDFRQRGGTTPVLLLTAFDELEDKVQGFESGADDYLTKPFYMKELSLRIQSLIKRTKAGGDLGENTQSNLLEINDLVIDLKDQRVRRAGQNIELTPREFQILVRLVKAGGAFVSKKELVREIWGSLFDHNTNTIEVYVNFLRNKIDKPFKKPLIKTRIGYGYYMETDPGAHA
jgi:DNA-binding response OmpR family regulator